MYTTKPTQVGGGGVTIGIRKNLVNIEDTTITTDEGTNEEGRCIKIMIKGLLDKQLHI